MYLITSHTSKNRSVSANETLSQKALSNMQPINNVSAAEETEQPLTRAATEIPINQEHFFVADIDNELDYVFLDEIIYVFLTIFLYLLKCPQSLILSALRAFCFCGKPHISRSIFLYFLYQTWLKSW